MRTPNSAIQRTGTTFPIVLILTVLSASSAAAPARPGAPQVTVGADLKQLIFDWSPVAGATHYRLLENRDGHSGFRQVGANILPPLTRARLSISVHLQRWSSARYIVSACNTAGCTDSAPVFPSGLARDAIGYFKASNTNADDQFGALVISADGQTLAVSAHGEDSGASGVNGNQASNSSLDSGAVYVFRRNGSRWRQEVYLKAGRNQARQFFGGRRFGGGFALFGEERGLSISGDGSILAIGAPGEDVSGFTDAGTVYVYRRCERDEWKLIGTLRAPQLRSSDFFGASVDLSVDGHTLKVNSAQERDARGLPNPELSTHIFVLSGGQWRRTATLGPVHAEDVCNVVRLSGDGRTLVSYCLSTVAGFVRAVTQKRSGEAWIHASDVELESFVPQPLALTFDATLMAVADLIPQIGTVEPAAVVYRWNGTQWIREVGILQPRSLTPESPAWAQMLAFDRTGRLLAIGDPASTLCGAGIAEPLQLCGAAHGAVILYRRVESNLPPWLFHRALKAPNPGVDAFGRSIGLSANGRTLAVGATWEDSRTTGIDGNQSDNSAQDAGAVYLY